MLIGIVGTIDRGNFVFDRWPRTKELPKVKGPMQAVEVSELLIQHFYYFGIFRKNEVLQMPNAAFSESCIIEIFNANEKRLEVVLGIDDQCVMVSRSVFITNNENSFGRNSSVTISTNLFLFEDLEEEKRDIVNSITLVWKADTFQEADHIKNKLSFMVGALRQMQQSEDYLSKQVIKITETKNNFQKKIKQKCLQLNKDSSMVLEEFKVKEIFQQFYQLAEEQFREISIFKQLEKFYISCACNEEFIFNSETWVSSVSSNFKIPTSKSEDTEDKGDQMDQKFSKYSDELTVITMGTQGRKDSMNDVIFKTTLATQKKLEMLPQALKDARINRLYTSVLNINDMSLQEILSREKVLNINGVLQIIQFIKQNQMGLNVYPFDLKKYYNLYALRKMPSWALIKKFDSRIFPQHSILKEVHPFSKFKRISLLDQKLKYLILEKMIKEVDVYIYYLENLKDTEECGKVKHFQVQESDEDEEDEDFDFTMVVNHGEFSEIEEYAKTRKYNVLANYVNKCCSLNEIIRQEPEFGKISEVLKLVIEKSQKRKPNSGIEESEEEKVYAKPKWGFYYVERP